MSIKEARAGLAVQLAPSGLPIDNHVPDLISPPCVVLEAPEDYITYGDMFDPTTIGVRMDVLLLVEHQEAANEWMTDQLDDALQKLWPHLHGDWTVTRTGKPGPLYTGEWLAYGIRLTVETYTSN